MMECALMTPDELKSIPKGNFVVMKSEKHPIKTRLWLFLDWGISFEEPYAVPKRANRTVALHRFNPCMTSTKAIGLRFEHAEEQL